MTTPRTYHELSLYFGLSGGAIAWTFHLIFAHVISEFGCVATLATRTFWSVTLVAWFIIVMSFALLLIATLATWVAYRARRRLRDMPDSASQHTNAHLAHLGLITSGLFVMIIAFQTLPIFVYLRHC